MLDCGMPIEVKRGQIGDKMAAIEKELAAETIVIDKLEKRIAPILLQRPADSKPTVGECGKVISLCQMAESLERFEVLIRKNNARIMYLLDIIEL